MARVQRRAALKISSAYRIVSEPAVLAIADVIPVDLLALEKKIAFDRKKETEGKVRNPGCLACGHLRDDTLFTCERWEIEWQQLIENIGHFTPDTIVGLMLKTESN